MNDIDFDELDRAVSSTMTPNAASEETPVTSPATPASPATPPASPAARRGGRFMDVVHPSSDMRGASTVPARPAVAAQPTPVSPPTPEPAAVNDWPDPIDSPFLADTKVEKRPLGGEQPTTEATPEMPEIPEAAPEAEIIPTATEPTAPEAVVPVTLEASAPEPEAGTVSSSEPSLEAPAEPLVEEPVVESAPHVTETTHATPVGDGGATSIQPQYTEAPSTAEASRPIFDTEAYHQPLAHPEKKKSGIFVVLWIIGLIILGAGLGAVMYFFVLPLL